MSQPNPNGLALSALPFDERVKLVHDEIQRRKNEANPANPTHFVTRLWVRWINANILDLPQGQGAAA